MTSASRFVAVAFAALLVVSSLPVPAAAAATPAPTLAASTSRPPDPTVFVPEAANPDILRHPEAMLGFGSRADLQRIPAAPDGIGAPAMRGATPAGAPGIDGAPVATPQPAGRPPVDSAPQPKASAPAGTAAAIVDAMGSSGGTAGSVQPATEASAAATPQVKGKVRLAGSPAAGTTVCLDDPSGPYSCVAIASTAADGSYALSAPAGTYLVRAWEPTSEYITGYWSPTGFQAYTVDAGQVTVVASDVTGIDFSLPLYPKIRGHLTGIAGAPIEGTNVSSNAYPNDGVVSAADGSYALRVFPGQSGTVHVNATAIYQPGWYSTSGVVLDQAFATTIHVVSSDVTGIDLAVPAWPRISGRVTDVHGAPVVGLSIRFDWGYYDTVYAGTDADGNYSVYARELGSWTGQYGGWPTVWIQQSIPIAATADVVQDVVLHAYPQVAGTVVDRDGQPLAGIAVMVGPYGYSNPPTTDENGSFSITYRESALTNVYYQDQTGVHVSGWLGPDGWTIVAPPPLQLAPDQVLDASVTLPSYVQLTGHVRLSDGTMSSGGWVQPRNPVMGVMTANVEPDGSFSVKLIPGAWTLGVPGGFYGAEGFAYASGAAVPFDIQDDLDLDLVLPVDNRLSGRVASPAGGGGGIEVDLFLDGTPFTSTVTADDGTWNIVAPPGQYLIGFYDGTHKRANGFYRSIGYTSDPDLATLVTLGRIDIGSLNITLPATRRIGGKATAWSGSYAVSELYVEAFVNGSFYVAAYTKKDGTYSLPVAPGKVTIWVFDPNLYWAPGWRTSTSAISATYANASGVTIASSDVTNANLHVPEASLIRIGTVFSPYPGSYTSAGGSITAYAGGAASSFGLIDESSGDHLVPVLPSTNYLIRFDADDSPYYAWTSGWRKGTTLTTDPSQATPTKATAPGTSMGITVPAGVSISGTVRDMSGTALHDIDVQVFANGTFYLDRVTSTGDFSFWVPPGTYRLAVIDMFDRYATGWLGPDGFVTSYAAARDVVVPADPMPLSLSIPMQPPPTPPTGVHGTPYHASALVAFTPPPASADRPLIHYAVTAHPGGRQCITFTTACLVTGLADGTPYTFTVTASSMTGASAASAASAPVVPLPVPDAAGGLLATQSGSDLVVSWAPAADNGSPITGYAAVATPGGSGCVPVPATALTCTIHGLADGRYAVDVTATNSHGTGPASRVAGLIDTVAPVVGAPTVSLRSGVTMSGSSVPVHVAWTASDPLAGITDTQLQVALGAGPFADQPLASPTSVTADRSLGVSASAYRLRDAAVDASGNVSAWATGPATYVALRQEIGAGVTYAGAWTTTKTSTALGGAMRSTGASGASVTYRFTGRAFTFVTRRGTNAGSAKVYVDGTLVATINLHAAATTMRWVAYARALAPGTHTVRIVNLATAGHPRLYVDAFATLR